MNNLPEERETPRMKTVKYMESLSDDKKMEMLKEAKFGTWYDGWKPYCLKCSFNGRMDNRLYGFQCCSCKNMIGFDLTRLQESPFNNK